MLADAYEQLRREATVASTRESSLRGLAILVRKGMAAWMHACAAVASAMPALPAAAAAVDGLDVSLDVQRQVVDVLTEMVLTTATEVTT